MSAPVVETKSRTLASGRVLNIPVGRKTTPSLPVSKAEAPVVAPPMVAKKAIPIGKKPVKAEGGGGSMPVKAEKKELSDEETNAIYDKYGKAVLELSEFIATKLSDISTEQQKKREAEGRVFNYYNFNIERSKDFIIITFNKNYIFEEFDDYHHSSQNVSLLGKTVIFGDEPEYGIHKPLSIHIPKTKTKGVITMKIKTSDFNKFRLEEYPRFGDEDKEALEPLDFYSTSTYLMNPVERFYIGTEFYWYSPHAGDSALLLRIKAMIKDKKIKVK